MQLGDTNGNNNNSKLYFYKMFVQYFKTQRCAICCRDKGK